MDEGEQGSKWRTRNARIERLIFAGGLEWLGILSGKISKVKGGDSQKINL